MSAYRKILIVCFAFLLSSCAATPVLIVKGDMSREIKQKAPVVRKVDISQSGRYALSGSMDSFILWDILQGKKIQTFTHEDWMGYGIAVAFSPDGKYFASGGKGTKLWDLATRQEIMSFDNSPALSITFSPDGKYFLCGGPGSLKIFNAATGGAIIDFKIQSSPKYRVESVAYSPDGKYVLSGGNGGIIDLWDISLGKSIRTVEIDCAVRALSFSSDGEYALSGGSDNIVRLWNAKNLTQIKKFVGHKGIWSVAFSPDGKYFLSAGIEGNIDIWELASGTKWRVLAGHAGVASYELGVSAKFSPNGKHVISAGDASTRIWDVSTGEEVASMIAFEDGEWIVTTANGYYNSSPKGDQYLRVKVRGKDYTIEQLRESFYRPDLVKLALGDGSLKELKNVADVKPPPIVAKADTPKSIDSAPVWDKEVLKTVFAPDKGQTLFKGTMAWGINRMQESPDGVLILEVSSSLIAAKQAGLVPGDIIVAVDSSPVKTPQDLTEKIKLSRPYTPVNILVQRSGTRFETSILPRGVLRLEVKDIDPSFTIPGVPPVVASRPVSAIDAFENINVLKEVLIDRASGQIEIIGSYDPKYATGPIPYLDLLKTALKYPEPVLNLISERSDYQEIHGRKNVYDVAVVSVLFKMPAAERERQSLIREMAAAYGITPEEYVKLYNYCNIDAKGGLAPPEIGRILVKVLRHLGHAEVAAAYEKLAGNNAESFAQALKILGKEAEARHILADQSKDKKQAENKLLALACIAMIDALGVYQPGTAGKLMAKAQAGEIKAGNMLANIYYLAPTSLNDKSGRDLMGGVLTKVAVGDAPTRVFSGKGDPLPVRIETTDIDRNSRLARIMYEADYAGKTFLLRPDLFKAIPGQTTYSEYISSKMKELGKDKEGGWYLDASFWFEPKRVEMQVSPDKNVVSFGASEIKFATTMDKATGSSKQEVEKLFDLYKDWCAQYTDNYELYAQAMPAFHNLREAAKVIALAKWLNSEKIALDLDSVRQERWDTPETVQGYWRWVAPYAEIAPGKFVSFSGAGITGGVTFKSNKGWTAVESTPKGETNLSEQLKLSSQLGEKAVDAANIGDMENARYLSELSAQALTGGVSRADLIKLNVPLADPVELPASPGAVLLQKEMIKKTHEQIVSMEKNPASRPSAAATLGQIKNLYDQVRENPVSASDYLHKLQTRQLSTVSVPTVQPVPKPSADDGSSSLQLRRELLGSLSDSIHNRNSGTNVQAQEILRSLKTKKPPELANLTKSIDNLVPGDVILVPPLHFKDWKKAGIGDVLKSNGTNLLDRWGSNNWSSPASHAAIFLGERNGKRWYMDNTLEHGPVIIEEQLFLKEYGQLQMDVATLVGQPISAEEGRKIFDAAHRLRDEGIGYGIWNSDKMVCSESARWLLLQAGREVPETQSANAKIFGIPTGLNKKDFVKYSPADFYDNEQYIVIHSLDLKRK